MSHLLELLGKALPTDFGNVLDRYYWTPQTRSIEQLAESCRVNPQWPDIRCQLGLAYLRAMQLAEAIEHLSAACRIKPDYLAARVALAAAYEADGKVERCWSSLR